MEELREVIITIRNCLNYGRSCNPDCPYHFDPLCREKLMSESLKMLEEYHELLDFPLV